MSTKINRACLKLEVLSHYSGSTIPRCANPFGIHKKYFVDLRCLTLDHIDGKGSYQKRKAGITGGGLARWLKSNNYPAGFQILCMNCQIIKKIVNKEGKLTHDDALQTNC
jgi:hypothetical protein